MKKELINITKKLVEFQTISSNKSELQKCLEYIQNYFISTKLFSKIFYSGGFPSLFISNSSSKKMDLILNGHIDVVDGAKIQFKPFIKNNRLYGRGTIDMKSSIAIMMIILKNVAQNSTKKIGAMFVCDEEIFGENGTKYLLDKGYRSKFSIITEESNFDIVTKQKGQITIKFEARGKSCHGSQPWTGKNAIENLISSYKQLRRSFPKDQKSSWEKPTINLGIIKGGTAANVIPDEAELFLDIRYPSISKLETVLKKMDKIIENHSVSYSILSKTFPMYSGDVDKYVKKLITITKKIKNKKSKLKWTNYCSDARYFSEKNMPVIEFGPTGGDYHSDNEYVEIDSLIKYYGILKEFILT